MSQQVASSAAVGWEAPELVPVRMLNEYAYCPRLAYLEWVEGEFRDNLETREGTFAHRNVDRPGVRKGRRTKDETGTRRTGVVLGKRITWQRIVLRMRAMTPCRARRSRSHLLRCLTTLNPRPSMVPLSTLLLPLSAPPVLPPSTRGR